MHRKLHRLLGAGAAAGAAPGATIAPGAAAGAAAGAGTWAQAGVCPLAPVKLATEKAFHQRNFISLPPWPLDPKSRPHFHWLGTTASPDGLIIENLPGISLLPPVPCFCRFPACLTFGDCRG